MNIVVRTGLVRIGCFGGQIVGSATET